MARVGAVHLVRRPLVHCPTCGSPSGRLGPVLALGLRDELACCASATVLVPLRYCRFACAACVCRPRPQQPPDGFTSTSNTQQVRWAYSVLGWASSGCTTAGPLLTAVATTRMIRAITANNGGRIGSLTLPAWAALLGGTAPLLLSWWLQGPPFGAFGVGIRPPPEVASPIMFPDHSIWTMVPPVTRWSRELESLGI